MTTTETLFFRDCKPYEALEKTVIPCLIKARARSRRLRFWSCACSSGQEPYSLAMLIRERFPELRMWDVHILATDISTEMLQRSRAGIYSLVEVNRGLPMTYRDKYFERRADDWHIKPELRDIIEFRELNLATPHAMAIAVDVILLRNVLIYFDVETKKQVLERVRKVLAPGGSLFLGTAETTMSLDDQFESVRSDGATYYRARQS